MRICGGQLFSQISVQIMCERESDRAPPTSRCHICHVGLPRRHKTAPLHTRAIVNGYGTIWLPFGETLIIYVKHRAAAVRTLSTRNSRCTPSTTVALWQVSRGWVLNAERVRSEIKPYTEATDDSMQNNVLRIREMQISQMRPTEEMCSCIFRA